MPLVLPPTGTSSTTKPHGERDHDPCAVWFNNNNRDYALRSATRFADLLSALRSPVRVEPSQHTE
ncbi:MAG TPA: hypothetical protein VKD47_01260 [Miltoncostaeaceae bacterium]|nr:hypothetical protein [Miltoncostaeaceae bacterium]